MLEDPTRFPFVAELEALYPVIRDEVEQLPSAAWLPWTAGNAQGVRVFPLLMTYRPPWIDDDFERRRSLCPQTWNWIRQQPSMFAAVVSALEPGGRILPHRDLEEPESVRCHLGLSMPGAGAATFRVGDATFEWRAGRCVVFHACHEHEGQNDGDAPRIILVVDVRPPGPQAR